MIRLNEKINGCQLELVDNCKAWLFNTEDFYNEIKLLDTFLSSDEKVACSKIIKDDFRKRYITRKGLLRIVLGGLINKAPESIEFEVNEYKKPMLKGYKDFFFNISHSANRFLIGVSRDSPIGVDIECNKFVKNNLSLLELITSHTERKILETIDGIESNEIFLKTFVQKESISKAIGMGMILDFKTITLYEDKNDFILLNKKITVHNNDLDVITHWHKDYYISVSKIL